MGDKAAEFVETWIADGVIAREAGGEADAQMLAVACLAEPEVGGVSETQIEATFGDLRYRMAGALELTRA